MLSTGNIYNLGANPIIELGIVYALFMYLCLKDSRSGLAQRCSAAIMELGPLARRISLLRQEVWLRG
jgi:hypothetical protein